MAHMVDGGLCGWGEAGEALVHAVIGIPVIRAPVFARMPRLDIPNPAAEASLVARDGVRTRRSFWWMFFGAGADAILSRRPFRR
ncbi:hypothetical protein RKD20_009149 [Streptomyces sp. SLBN-8D4]